MEKMVKNIETDLRKVSICIPIYNRKRLVEATMHSALAQCYDNLEIIVVDNASDDGTWELLQEKYARVSEVKLFRNSENIGPVKNWLKCISLANGDFTKILFSDDMIADNYLTECMKVFRDDVAFVVTPAKSGQKLENAKTTYLHRRNVISRDIFRSYLVSHPGALVSPGAALFRTKDLQMSFVQALPDYDSHGFSYFGAGPDLLLFLQTLERYNCVAYASKTFAFLRSHDGSATTSAIKSRSWPIRECYNKTRAWHLMNHGTQYDIDRLAGRILLTNLFEKRKIISQKEISDTYYGLKSNYKTTIYYAMIFALKSLRLRFM